MKLTIASILEDIEKEKGWIGVDLDGTLSLYSSGDYDENKIGDPVESMLQLVKSWIKDGKRVKIFTARVYKRPDLVPVIQSWLIKNGLPKLEVTNQKDPYMIELWDDRAKPVEFNKGLK